MENCILTIECSCHIFNFDCGFSHASHIRPDAKFNDEVNSSISSWYEQRCQVMDHYTAVSMSLYVSFLNNCLHGKFWPQFSTRVNS